MNDELQQILKKELISLNKSSSLLQESYRKCMVISIKKSYSNDELEVFEALTARFSRLSDLLIQRIFRLIDTVELIGEGSVMDRLNRAEKRLLIPTAKQFAEIKLLRNLIVHEYEPDEYARIFKNV